MEKREKSAESAGKRPRGERPVIGWREWLALPELGIASVKAKVDTGARSSALHAFEPEFFQRRGREIVRFSVHPLQRDDGHSVRAEAEVVDRRAVRNPGGRSEVRPVILTSVTLMGETWPIELTLTSRDQMGFRMLLGRQAIRGRFCVDPGRSYRNGRPGARGKQKRRSERKEP